MLDVPDPIVFLQLGKHKFRKDDEDKLEKKYCRTSEALNNINPVFNETFTFELNEE
jgi:hypothetical protein